MANDFIPVSGQIPSNKEIGIDLSVLKQLMNVSDDLLGELLSESPKTLRDACYLTNDKIELNLLYKLYYFANKHWLNNYQSVKEEDSDKVRCTRRLRDACDKEISRRMIWNHKKRYRGNSLYLFALYYSQYLKYMI